MYCAILSRAVLHGVVLCCIVLYSGEVCSIALFCVVS